MELRGMTGLRMTLWIDQSKLEFADIRNEKTQFCMIIDVLFLTHYPSINLFNIIIRQHS